MKRRNSCWRGLFLGAILMGGGALMAATGRVNTPASIPVDAPSAISFNRYQIILDRKPFGAEPVAPPVAATTPAAPPAPLPESVFKNIRMCAITRNDVTGNVQVGLTDSAAKKNYFLTVGETEDGITVLAADYEKETARLSKEGAEKEISMTDVPIVSGGPASVAPIATSVARGPLPSPVASSSVPASRAAAPAAQAPGERYAAEREAVMAARRERMGVTNQLSGEALKKHLEKYQMDLIRAGGQKGPPLPMQLTPEMDAQLVREGVLPPQ